MRKFLHFSLVFAFISCNYVQAQKSSSTQISVNTTINDGDSETSTSDTVNADNVDDALRLLDSILGKNGIDVNSLKSKIGKLELFNQGDMNDLDDMIKILSQKFNFLDSPESVNPENKVVLGVILDEYSNTFSPEGAHPVITEIVKNSAAENCGLKKNDMIYQLDGNTVSKVSDILSLLKEKNVNDSLQISYIRNGDTLHTTAKLLPIEKGNTAWLSLFEQKLNDLDSCLHKKAGPICEKIIVQKSGPRLGVKVKDLDAEARKSLKAKKGGALVTKIQPQSTASEMNLQVNDVITSVNGNEILNVADLKSVVNHFELPKEIEVRYIRYGKKKKVKGLIDQYNKPWDEDEMMNIINMPK